MQIARTAIRRIGSDPYNNGDVCTMRIGNSVTHRLESVLAGRRVKAIAVVRSDLNGAPSSGERCLKMLILSYLIRNRCQVRFPRPFLDGERGQQPNVGLMRWRHNHELPDLWLNYLHWDAESSPVLLCTAFRPRVG